MNKPSLSLALFAILLMTLTTACYRMPTDDDYSLIPSTNHPDYAKESPGGKQLPGLGY